MADFEPHVGWEATMFRLLAAVLARYLRLLVPSLNHHCVGGWPDSEGNATEVVAGLCMRGESVIWLVEDEVFARQFWQANYGHVTMQPRIINKSKIRAVALFASARYVFFTHGLYGKQIVLKGKKLVNLWHGDGPKVNPRRAPQDQVFANFLLSASEAYLPNKLNVGNVTARPIRVGNPRCQLFDSGVSPTNLANLGLNPDRPYIVYAPTYRSARRLRHREGWSDSASSTEKRWLEESIGQWLRESCEVYGYQLVVKPHPLDADSYSEFTNVLSQDLLDQHFVPLYSFLGQADALVSDYSSIWVDWLATGKPLAFLIADIDDYTSARGIVQEPPLDALPIPRLGSRAQVEEFVANIATGQLSPSALDETRRALQYSQHTNPVTTLLEQLDTQPRVTGASKRLATRDSVVTAVDQLISSASNFLLVVLVARASSIREFAAFSLAFLVVTFVIGLVRSGISEVALVAHEPPPGVDPFLGRKVRAAALMGLLGALLILAATLAIGLPSHREGELLPIALALSVALPFAAVQDAVRYVDILSDRPEVALTRDVAWVLVLLVGWMCFDSAPTLILFWALGALVSVMPNFKSAFRLNEINWFRTEGVGLRARRYIGEYIALNASNIVVWLILGTLLGAQVIASLRGAFILMAPLNSLFTLVLPLLVPVLRLAAPRKFVGAAASGLLFLLSVTIAWSVIVVSFPPLGAGLIGATWAGTEGLMAPVAVHYVLLSVFFVMIAVLRATDDLWGSGLLRYSFAITTLAGPCICGALWGPMGAAIGFPIALVMSFGVVALGQLMRSRTELG